MRAVAPVSSRQPVAPQGIASPSRWLLALACFAVCHCFIMLQRRVQLLCWDRDVCFATPGAVGA